MNRITWKHAVAGLVLLATLSLVAPIPAQAAVGGADGRGDAWSDGWSWISSLWDGLVMTFGGGAGRLQHAPPAPATARPHGPAVEKSTTDNGGGTASGDWGPLINPDGQPPV
jgi:hypothetical protein